MSEEITQPLPNDVLKLILARFDSVDKRLDSIDSNVHSLDARLTVVEEKVDRRLQETRPIWERALAEIAELRTEMREGFEKVRSELSHGLRRVNHKIDILNHDILEVRADLRYMDERVTKLEPETP
jgi:chromosome segregation ATPase